MFRYHPDLLAAPVPRYTSYPTAAQFSDAVGAGDMAARLDGLRGDDVLRLDVRGHLNERDWEALRQAVARAAAQARALLADWSGLQLEPDQADLAALGAQGYVAEVAARLQAMQAEGAQPEEAAEALRLLLRYQRELANGSAQ